jgi:hypothetical protein
LPFNLAGVPQALPIHVKPKPRTVASSRGRPAAALQCRSAFDVELNDGGLRAFARQWLTAAARKSRRRHQIPGRREAQAQSTSRLGRPFGRVYRISAAELAGYTEL